ncbi:MAG: hypothetical protein IJ593_10295 [Lachnospiraceae bacterium]|nr:hypothetical protein [Lachnospiraceae bacterium]
MKTPLIDSKYLDKDIIYKRFGMGKYELFKIDETKYIETFGKKIYDLKQREKDIKAELKLEQDVKKQYINDNLNEVIETYGEENVVNFLNELSSTFNESKTHIYYDKGSFGEISDEVKRKFYNLSLNVNTDYNISFTRKQFLKLCRVCFAAAPSFKFKNTVSDYYVYSFENKFTMEDDDIMIKSLKEDRIIKKWAENDFERAIEVFGEMNIYKSNISLSETKDGNYEMKINLYYLPDIIKGILMYIGLRENGYNILVDAKAVLKAYEKYNFES